MNKFNKIFNLIVDIGEILISCDADILRVIETMDIIAKSYDIKEFNSFIITNGLFVTATFDGVTLAKNKQIRSHCANLGKIESINSLSRKIASEHISIEEATEILENIKTQSIWPTYIKYLSAIIGCSTLTMLYKGTYIDGFVTVFVALFSYHFMQILIKKSVNSVLINLLTSVFITILAVITSKFGLCDNLDKVIIGSIMPLVPGILLTNGIRDITNNDFLSGIIRVIEAILIASSIAIGVGLVFNFV